MSDKVNINKVTSNAIPLEGGFVNKNNYSNKDSLSQWKIVSEKIKKIFYRFISSVYLLEAVASVKKSWTLLTEKTKIYFIAKENTQDSHEFKNGSQSATEDQNFFSLHAISKHLKYFTPDLLYRAKIGTELKMPFLPKEMMPPHLHSCIDKFHTFNVIPKSPSEKNPLDKGQMEKARELEITEADPAKKRELRSLIRTSLAPGATRENWKIGDWRAFDRIRLALIQEYYKAILLPLLNSSYFDEFQCNAQNKFDIDYKESLIAQTLAFSLAYTENIDGEKIEIPVFCPKEGKFHLIEYIIVHHVLGVDQPMYFIQPTSMEGEAHPWIVFRGTQTHAATDRHGQSFRAGAMDSLHADLIDPKGIAEGLLIEALVRHQKVKDHQGKSITSNLNDRLDFWKKQGKECMATGHSLGGNLAAQLVIRKPNCIRTAYTFDAPWLSVKLGSKWNKLLAKDEVYEEQIVNWAIERDLVPGSGYAPAGKYISVTPMKMAEYPYESNRRDPLFWHGQNLLSRHFKAQLVDVEAEKNKRIRSVVEFLRKFFGIQVSRKLKNLPDWHLNCAENYQRFKAMIRREF